MRSAGLPPGPDRPPLVQALDWVRRPLPFLKECRRRYGDVFTMRLAATPSLIMLSEAAAIREVFTGDPVLRSG